MIVKMLKQTHGIKSPGTGGVIRWRALLALLAALVPGLAPGLARAQEDEILPGGSWQVTVSQHKDSQQDSWGRNDRHGTLLQYLVPDITVREQLSGKVTREYQRRKLEVGVGLIDTWSLHLSKEQVVIRQDSDIQTAGTDPEVLYALAATASTEVSGSGNLEATLLHRLFYNDYNSVVLGWGGLWPEGRVETPWYGRATLMTAAPARAGHVLLHYTRYPSIRHSRFDLRVFLNYSDSTWVRLPEGEWRKLYIGNRIEGQLGWRQEFGMVSTGFLFQLLRQGNSSLGGILQHDHMEEESLRFELGLGNLVDLEQGPVTLPYRIGLTAERTIRGFNVPVRNALIMDLKIYF
ncbi:MAG: hypothetical protein OEZ59_02620 [Deltaproteobacteria bacterium]|nr:hypothetical protein [Deltaproteobacteria bacterium]